MAYKKTTRKTSGGAKMTTTYNTNGNVRRTHTVKPTKSLTISRSVNRNGSVRTTTTNNINGWVTRKSTTSGNPPKIKKQRIYKTPKITKSRSYRRSRGGDAGGEFFLAILGILLLAPFWLTGKLWQAAQSTVLIPDEGKNFTWYCKVFGYFMLYFWCTALLLYWGSIWLFT